MNSNIYQQRVVKTDRIIYTPSVFAKSNLLHLQEIGSLEALKPHTSRRENLASYLFIMVTEGSGSLDYNNKTYDLKKGCCAFIDCKKPHSHYTEKDLWSIKWAHFYGPNLGSIYDKYIQRGGQFVFKSRALRIYDSILREIYGYAGSDDSLRDMKIYSSLTRLITALMEESLDASVPAKSRKRQNLQHIKDYLDQNYNKRITLDELSEKFFINKFYLTRIFKEQFGVSVNNYIQQKKITNAKKLLRFSNLTIEEIANECGVEDSNYFSRMFKKIERLTPCQYRSLW